MPSNHIYGILRDHLGYLWLATPRGVVRYNGYDWKLFNQSDGISNEDIWELCEDKKGRMWLSNISDEFGYLYNNAYSKSHIEGTSYTIYPKDVRPFDDGIMFASSHIAGNARCNVCITKGDTIYKFDLNSLFDKVRYSKYHPIATLTQDSGHMVIIYDCQQLYSLSMVNDSPKIQYKFTLSELFRREFSGNFVGYLRNYLVSYSEGIKSDKFLAVRLDNQQTQEIDIKRFSVPGNISYVCFDSHGDGHFYVMADENILKFECGKDSVRLVHIFNARKLLGNPDIDANKITTFHLNKFWGNCIGTSTNGLFLNYGENNLFVKEENIDLENYECIGGLQDSISFWWSNTKYKLAVLRKGWDIQYHAYDTLRRIYSIVPHNADTFIANCAAQYLFDIKTGRLKKVLYRNVEVRKMITDGRNAFYATGASGFIKIVDSNTVSDAAHFFDRDRYNDLIYDSTRRSYWAYNFDRIFVHGQHADTLFGKKQLLRFGVEKVEKIAVDNKYGNLFFKGSNNITICDFERNTYRELFAHFNLKESSFLIYGDIFIVTGRMGALFCKIQGRNNISEPLYYANLKNRNFNFVYDFTVLAGKLIMNTDKGVYSVQIPNDAEIANAKQDSTLYYYKFVLYNGGIIKNIVPGDTIAVNQKDERLQFDAINPFGNGHVKYVYRLQPEAAWRELNANELTLPHDLKPDRYYDFELRAYDNVWESDISRVHIYIVPYWYQTAAGRRGIWLSSVLLFILFLAATVLITRKLVLKGAQKRNMRMELELKSMYAQLNPHFVFNTLTIALNMIKKEKLGEASLHISRFARLLRSYLDSSRNRVIKLSDELSNIKNYVEIQQTRFANIFTFEIVLGIDAGKSERILIPSLLLQPIIENAINHGLLPKGRNGHLKIEIRAGATADEIVCIIDDNGVGRGKSKFVNENDVKKKSHGTDLLSELIAIINKYEKFSIEISYIDKAEPLTGTTVQLSIKSEEYGKV